MQRLLHSKIATPNYRTFVLLFFLIGQDVSGQIDHMFNLSVGYSQNLRSASASQYNETENPSEGGVSTEKIFPGFTTGLPISFDYSFIIKNKYGFTSSTSFLRSGQWEISDLSSSSPARSLYQSNTLFQEISLDYYLKKKYYLDKRETTRRKKFNKTIFYRISLGAIFAAGNTYATIQDQAGNTISENRHYGGISTGATASFSAFLHLSKKVLISSSLRYAFIRSYPTYRRTYDKVNGGTQLTRFGPEPENANLSSVNYAPEIWFPFSHLQLRIGVSYMFRQ